MSRRIEAIFHPQYDDKPHRGPIGVETTWDATEAVLSLPLQELQALRDDDYASDHLVPAPILDSHSGPYRVEVVEAIEAFFGGAALSELTQAQLDQAREEVGLGVEKTYEIIVTRTSRRQITLAVSAGTQSEALQRAQALAFDTNFHDVAEAGADYTTELAGLPVRADRSPRP